MLALTSQALTPAAGIAHCFNTHKLQETVVSPEDFVVIGSQPSRCGRVAVGQRVIEHIYCRGGVVQLFGGGGDTR